MKNSKKLLGIILICTILIPVISYAISKDEKFFTVDKTEAYIGDTITMNIDLSLIDYDDFEFILTSNMNLKQISTEQSEIASSTQDNQFKIISNKSEINLNKIALYYKIPEDVKVGDKIELTGTIQKYSSSEEEIEDTQYEKQEVTITVTIVEQSTNTNQTDEQTSNQQQQTQSSQTQQSQNQQSQNQQSQIQSQTQQTQEKSQEQNKTQVQTQSQTQTQIQTQTKTQSNSQVQDTNVYKGESNNYLSKLKVKGYELNTDFSKTNNTYFLEVEDDVEKISITAEAEDDNAIVNIYGNEDLQDGENKVLISVTAENGEVKIYRIYVIK